MAVRPARFASPAVGDERSFLPAGLRPVAALVGRHRRLLAALCAGAAVAVAVSALTPPSPPASVDRSPASSLLPDGAGRAPAEDAGRVAVTVRLADAAGLLLLRQGSHAEVLAGPAADAAGGPAASGAASAGAEVLAPDAVVLAVPQPPAVSGTGTGTGTGSVAGGSGLLAPTGTTSGGLDGVVVLAVPPSDARRIAAAAGARAVSVAVAVASGN